MDFATVAAFADQWHTTGDVLAIGFVLATRFDSHFWRWLCGALAYAAFQQPVYPVPSIPWWAFLLYCIILIKVPTLRFGQKTKGCVLVTGADSGMGQATVVHLAKHATYDVIFAGAFDKAVAEKALAEKCKEAGTDMATVVVVPLDVSKDASVEAAQQAVAKKIEATPNTLGLTAVICFHGIAMNGPIQYMPVDMFQRTYEVNYVGNVRMTQAFLPMVRKAVGAKPCRDAGIRGRLIYTGTGGGPCSPCPSLLSAYMSSKFAGEAFVQSLRMELSMTRQPIDCSVINPGFVKPTLLISEGQKLTERMWKACETRFGDNRAKDEFGAMMDHFNVYAAKIPGTHVSEVCKAALHGLTAYRPRSSYKVGIDSKLAPIVGMLPTGVRDFISHNGMYGFLSPAGTVKGYQVG